MMSDLFNADELTDQIPLLAEDPIVILQPFWPVLFFYEFSDTMGP